MLLKATPQEKSFQIIIFSKYMPRSGIPESYSNFIFGSLRGTYTIFHSCCASSHFHQQRVLLYALSNARLSTSAWTVAFQAPLSRGFPGKNTGVGCHFLFQGILPTQGLNLHLLHLLHCQPLSLPLAPAVLFTTSEMRKQPQYPQTDKQMSKEDVVHTYNGILLSHKKE